MPKTFIKLTLLIDVEEIDSFLSDCPDCLQQEFASIRELQPKNSNAELRQQLINHVVSHIPQRYEVIDCTQECSEKPKMPYGVLEEGLQVKVLVQDGIFQILPDSSEASRLALYQIPHFEELNRSNPKNLSVHAEEKSYELSRHI